MFLVFNKDKIYAYGISIITVILLFCAASTMLTDNPERKHSRKTTTNI